MAGNDLVGNMDTEAMVNYLEQKDHYLDLDKNALMACRKLAEEIFV